MKETEINETFQSRFNIEDNYINDELGKEIYDVINKLKFDEKIIYLQICIRLIYQGAMSILFY